VQLAALLVGIAAPVADDKTLVAGIDKTPQIIHEVGWRSRTGIAATIGARSRLANIDE
jgi:hypothetical protein